MTEFTGLATILSIALISVLLNLTALESAFNRDIDVHREMRLVDHFDLTRRVRRRNT